MRAVSYSEYGGPEVLQVVDLPDPEVGEGSVRVRVRAAGLNPFDYKVRRGGYLPSHTLPSLQGAEFAGDVDAVGDGVTGWAAGDEVLGWVGRGAQAELVVVPAKNLARKPASLAWAAAAGIGLVGNTAKRSTESLGLGDADTVFVSGASGGVGLLSAQFALRTGAKVVGSAGVAHHDFLAGLGIVPVAYGDGMLDRLREAAPQGFTAMLDTIGGESIEAGLALGIPPERINTIADSASAQTYGLNTVGGGGKTSAELEELAVELADGRLVLPVRAAFPLDQVTDAFRELESRHGSGKVVLLL